MIKYFSVAFNYNWWFNLQPTFYYFSVMKKLMILFIVINLNAQEKVGNFKVYDHKIIWQKTYNKSININNQSLTFKALALPKKKSNFWISGIRGANLKVEKKKAQTRLSVIDIYSIPRYYFTFGWFFGIEQNVRPNYIEEKYLSRKKSKEKFIKKDAITIDLIIQNEINSIIELNESDW